MLPFSQKISELFLDIEGEVGTTALNNMFLIALKKAIHDFEEKNDADFFAQFYELLQLVKNTEPRVSLIIDNLYEIWKALLTDKLKGHPEGHRHLEKKVGAAILSSQKTTREERKKLTMHGVGQVHKNDVILIHSISGSVLDVLFEAKKAGKDFRVVIAEQEAEKTQQLIELLSEGGIRFQVVPEYMLSHVESEVTKVFLGGVTINDQLAVVGDSGSNAIVSEFHLRETPIYLFMSTRKFSLWKSRESHHTYKVKNIKTLANDKHITYERIKFSHDRIPLEFYDHIVTEAGILTPKETEKLYRKKYDERKPWRDKFFQDQ